MSRLLVVTSLWPTQDHPTAGVFVQRRLEGVECAVVAPTSYQTPVVLRYLRLLWSALRATGPFYAVEAHVLFPTGAIGLVNAWIRRIPLVVYAHGADVRVTSQENFAYRSLARLVVRRATVIAVNSRSTAQLVARLGREAVVIPPGVDLGRFHPTPRPEVRRVLFLGGTRAWKGYEIAQSLADTCVGPGLKTVYPPEVPALIAAHDIVLVPSRHEPFGLVAAEAIACGRWVVASDVEGLREVVTDGVNGTLVRDGDYAAAIANVPDYDPLAVAATAARFDWRIHRARMESLYHPESRSDRDFEADGGQ